MTHIIHESTDDGGQRPVVIVTSGSGIPEWPECLEPGYYGEPEPEPAWYVASQEREAI